MRRSRATAERDVIETAPLRIDDLALDLQRVDEFGLGGRAPRLAVAPHDAAALAAIQKRANDAGLGVVVFGGATMQALGNAPTRYDIAISLARLTRVLAYESRDLTIAVEAGMSVATLSSTLAEAGQFVPLDAPRAATATVGGTLAAGWRGPRRTTYGSARDLVIGTEAILADGTHAHAGGMVVKNVTGYDVGKLYIGSLGTLGTLVRVNFKCLPLPPVRRIAIAPLSDENRERALAHLAALEIEPTCALLVRGFDAATPDVKSDDPRLFVLFEGSDAVVERATRDLRSALGAAGIPSTTIVDRNPEHAFARVLDAYIDTLGGRSITFRSTGLPSTVLERCALADEVARDFVLRLDTIVDLRSGDLTLRFVAPKKNAFAQIAATLADDLRERLVPCTILAGDAAARSGIDAWGSQPPAMAAMRSLKSRFDERATLAPGRFVGGI